MERYYKGKDNGIKILRYDDSSNMHGRGRYRDSGRKYSKENFHLEAIYADSRTQIKYTVQQWG
jgi:hypothetical protein